MDSTRHLSTLCYEGVYKADAVVRMRQPSRLGPRHNLRERYWTTPTSGGPANDVSELTWRNSEASTDGPRLRLHSRFLSRLRSSSPIPTNCARPSPGEHGELLPKETG